ncbi:unnamed protein product [Strongylus vulgaris]|uniref:Uncharacterized protein n=1 Tax=Strongylus vulgaris TaxID=40348 RepID=A0A3P7IB39_STRVU|nr:unnamed protein product [Strongylus vulgaris]
MPAKIRVATPWGVSLDCCEKKELVASPHVIIKSIARVGFPLQRVDISAENDVVERPSSRSSHKKCDVMILKPREVVHPSPPSTPNVRRSKRNRMKPVRQWLGELPVYEVSPGGSKTLVGVNEVEVRDKRWLKVRSANLKIAQEREMQLREQQRRLREKRREEARRRKLVKIRELKLRHKKGEDLHTTIDSIVTSSDEDDEEDDIEAIVHVR